MSSSDATGAPAGPSYREALEEFRRVEIEQIRDWFPPRCRVLEIGGGDGYQAGILSSWGCQVTSVDLPVPGGMRRYHPVQEYDGRRLPLPDEAFDVVFSSNVLEHVPWLGELLGESRRVLRPGGVAIHILPSPAWRLWTSAGHYLHVGRRILQWVRAEGGGAAPLAPGEGRRWTQALAAALWPRPHGAYRSAIAELYYFSRGRWRRQFERCGFRVLRVESTRLFYTGHVLWPTASLRQRRRMAHLLGSACHVFMVARR